MIVFNATSCHSPTTLTEVLVGRDGAGISVLPRRQQVPEVISQRAKASIYSLSHQSIYSQRITIAGLIKGSRSVRVVIKVHGSNPRWKPLLSARGFGTSSKTERAQRSSTTRRVRNRRVQ